MTLPAETEVCRSRSFYPNVCVTPLPIEGLGVAPSSNHNSRGCQVVF
jgi:hypothetical protein